MRSFYCHFSANGLGVRPPPGMFSTSASPESKVSMRPALYFRGGLPARLRASLFFLIKALFRFFCHVESSSTRTLFYSLDSMFCADSFFLVDFSSRRNPPFGSPELVSTQGRRFFLSIMSVVNFFLNSENFDRIFSPSFYGFRPSLARYAYLPRGGG